MLDFGSLGIPTRKFILDECSVLFYLHDITRWDSLTWPIPVLGILAIDLSFLLESFKLNQSDELSLNKKLTSHLLKGKHPQLWEESTWLTPGYGHLLNHTKNDQPGNYETRLGAFMNLAYYYP